MITVMIMRVIKSGIGHMKWCSGIDINSDV